VADDAATACRCPSPSSTGRRQSGHSGRSGSHLPMQSAWNAWPHAGSARTAAGSGPERPSSAAPAVGSSDRHTAHSRGGAGEETASTSGATVAPLRASSSFDDDDVVMRARTAVAQAATVTAPAAAAAAISAAGVGEWILRFLVLCVRAAVSVAMRAGVYSRETATWAQQRQLARAPRVR